jgi:hypothetical protein
VAWYCQKTVRSSCSCPEIFFYCFLLFYFYCFIQKIMPQQCQRHLCSYMKSLPQKPSTSMANPEETPGRGLTNSLHHPCFTHPPQSYSLHHPCFTPHTKLLTTPPMLLHTPHTKLLTTPPMLHTPHTKLKTINIESRLDLLTTVCTVARWGKTALRQ